jgi:8-oxo-dGTP pyrophosphatase MutT (NUDIX family)
MSEAFAHPVVSMIIENERLAGYVLLQKRTKPEPEPLSGLFELPQGRLRQAESLADCAKRELQEETGLQNLHLRRRIKRSSVLTETLESVEAIAVVETGQHSYLAICVIGSAEGTPTASAESSDPGWYSRAEVLDFISSHRIFPLNVPMLLAYYACK